MTSWRMSIRHSPRARRPNPLEKWPAAIFVPDHPWTAPIGPTFGRPNALLRVCRTSPSFPLAKGATFAGCAGGGRDAHVRAGYAPCWGFGSADRVGVACAARAGAPVQKVTHVPDQALDSLRRPREAVSMACD